MAAQKLMDKRIMFIEGANVSLIKGIVDDMLDLKVLNEGEKEEVIENNKVTRDRARSLIDMVRKKGNSASEKFLEKLLSRDHNLYTSMGLDDQSMKKAKSDLQETSGPQGTQSAGPETWLTLSTSEFIKSIQEKEADSIYEVFDKRERKRLALLINNVEFDNPKMKRNGAMEDQSQMKRLLEELGYRVDIHNNLSAQEVEQALKNFASHEDHKLSDSTFVVLMSHGLRNGICGKHYQDGDTDIFSTDKIFDIFNAKNCAALREKPKVIIIQACRGSENGSVWVSDSLPALSDDGLKKTHKEKDFICFCSSTPDTVSWRHPQEGSLLIQRIVEVFRQDAYHDHIEELFRKVQSRFKEFPLQMPTKERTTLLKKFYLFPGF
ncbi:caspase-1-like isoform X3 [Erpetoichthys calabaricus]|uniref:caspase-1-like isoform X2 n=2 Tax=Erpetoichthys calabaricus TaxID=27687 RepID=UPI002234DC97|nr:caspase-1-like isoform X2 [Erpetoichthys calabaricus]XP_051787294.1 caspase-1-like isoform X3 [Erpetoichthys calabaricus]